MKAAGRELLGDVTSSSRWTTPGATFRGPDDRAYISNRQH